MQSEGRQGVHRVSTTPRRDALQDYLDEVANLPVLEPQEQTSLFESMRAAEEALRRALAEIPETAQFLLDRWRSRIDERLVTGALSRFHRDGSGRDLNQQIDRQFRRIESSLAELNREDIGAGEAQRNSIRDTIAEQVYAAEVALPILLEALEIAEDSGAVVQDPRSRRALDDAIEARAQLTDSKNRFISHNLRLVIRCAKHYRNQGVPFLDLIQEGSLGLIRAVEKFDDRRGFKFSTYAVWWIEQSLNRSITTDSRVVRIPGPVLDQRRKLQQIERVERASRSKEPSDAALAERLGLNPDDADDLRRSLSPEVSIHFPVGFSETRTLEDTLSGCDGEGMENDLDRCALGRRVRKMIPSLEERAQSVIRARFGLGGEAPRTLADIGQELGLSRERVRQIELEAIEHLRRDPLAQSLAAEWGDASS